MFMGRETELKFLQDKYSERKGQLIVLYGRRRVGKTETLREFCRDSRGFLVFWFVQSMQKPSGTLAYRKQKRYTI